jgi:hypothetical protein
MRARTSSKLARTALLAGALSSACGSAEHRLGGTPELCRDGASVELIDSMEDRDISIDFRQGRSGFWFAYNNGTGTQVPQANGELFVMEKVEPARAGSHFAVRTHGAGFTGEWGAGIGFDLHSKSLYDSSSYAGIAFWARRAPDTSFDLWMDVPDRNTDPSGGVCDVNAARCNDSFGADPILGEDWRYFAYQWSELFQVGWSGVLYPEGVKTTAIYGLRFQSQPNMNFDFWIDDVAFLCAPQ